jgi:TolA-binding protein
MGARLPGSSHPPVLGSTDSNNLFAKGDTGVLSYVTDLEMQVKQLNEKVQMMEEREKHQEQHITRLSGEIYALRSQLAGQQQQQQHYPLPLPPGSMS